MELLQYISIAALGAVNVYLLRRTKKIKDALKTLSICTEEENKHINKKLMEFRKIVAKDLDEQNKRIAQVENLTTCKDIKPDTIKPHELIKHQIVKVKNHTYALGYDENFIKNGKEIQLEEDETIWFVKNSQFKNKAWCSNSRDFFLIEYSNIYK